MVTDPDASLCHAHTHRYVLVAVTCSFEVANVFLAVNNDAPCHEMTSDAAGDILAASAMGSGDGAS